MSPVAFKLCEYLGSSAICLLTIGQMMYSFPIYLIVIVTSSESLLPVLLNPFKIL